MPTSPLMKRPSAAGRLLASLRPPRRAGPLPVQTGFPTSLADLVVKNHVRPTRRRHRPSVAPPAAAVAEPPPQRCEVLTGRNAVVKGAAFRIRPELLAVGGAVALALLVIWSKWLVAAATAASVALFWIDSVRASPFCLQPRLQPQVCVSPIREAESEAETPTRSDERGSEVSSPLWAADTVDLGGGDDLITPKSKENRRSSLRKLIPKKLRNGKRSSTLVVDFNKDTATGSLQHPDDAASEAVVNTTTPALQTSEPRNLPAPAVDDTTTPPDAIAVEKGCSSRKAASAFPSPAAFVPVILVGLVAGKIPAVALTVICAVLFLIEHSRQSAS